MLDLITTTTASEPVSTSENLHKIPKFIRFLNSSPRGSSPGKPGTVWPSSLLADPVRQQIWEGYRCKLHPPHAPRHAGTRFWLTFFLPLAFSIPSPLLCSSPAPFCLLSSTILIACAGFSSTTTTLSNFLTHCACGDPELPATRPSQHFRARRLSYQQTRHCSQRHARSWLPDSTALYAIEINCSRAQSSPPTIDRTNGTREQADLAQGLEAQGACSSDCRLPSTTPSPSLRC